MLQNSLFSEMRFENLRNHGTLSVNLVMYPFLHWQIQGVPPACPPTGPNSLVFAYISTKSHSHQRSATNHPLPESESVI